MLVGEPGIGKTATARAVGAAAEDHALLLWGRCFEGDWQPPYAPWAEALGGHFGVVDPNRLREQLGDTAPLLATFVPGLQGVIPALHPPTPLRSDEAQFRLYDAVARALSAISSENPVVLVLDDLHWADAGSRHVLLHVARRIRNTRLLLIGTYRDEVDRTPEHPLGEVVAELRRDAECEHIALAGLNLAEVEVYLAGRVGDRLAQDAANNVLEQTDGNPFYVGELARHLQEIGWQSGPLRPPATVRQVVRARLSRLSTVSQQILFSGAAFAGGFELAEIVALTRLAEEAVLDAIDEAMMAGLVRSVPGLRPRYELAHAIVRNATLDELNPDRTARLHRKVAAMLEDLGRGTDRAGELAFQYHASAALPGAEAGVAWCVTAADQARNAAGPDRAVDFLEMARHLAAEAGDTVAVDLLRRLAVAQSEALALQDAHASAREAMLAMGRLGVVDTEIAEFLAEVARNLKHAGAPLDLWQPLVDEVLGLCGERRDLTWARLTLLVDRFERISSGSVSALLWRGHDPEAVAIARGRGDEEDDAATLEPFQWRSAEETVAVRARSRAWRSSSARMRALDVVARDLLHTRGRFREAVETLDELRAVALRSGSLVGQAEAWSGLAAAHAALGDLTTALHARAMAVDFASRLGPSHRLHVVAERILACLFAHYTGRGWVELSLEVPVILSSGEAVRSPFGLLVAGVCCNSLAKAGDRVAAESLLVALVSLLERADPTSYQQAGALHMACEAVWELGERPLTARCRQLALALRASDVGDSPLGSTTLSLARMAGVEGDIVAARHWFDEARRVAVASGRRPLRAICDYDEAVLLSRAGEARASAEVLLDSAAAAFERLGMDGWREQATSLLRQLRPMRPPDGLTGREVEVLGLVASGRANKEIAAALCLSVATVERHVANVYRKIGVTGRVEAATYALRHKLG